MVRLNVIDLSSFGVRKWTPLIAFVLALGGFVAVAVTDRIIAAPELVAMIGQFSAAYYPELKNEAGDLILVGNHWIKSHEPSSADHLEIANDIKRVLDKHDIKQLKNRFAPTSRVREDLDNAIRNLSSHDKTPEKKIEILTAVFKDINSDKEIQQFSEYYSTSHNKPLIYDHLSTARRELLDACDSSLGQLDQLVQDLKASIQTANQHEILDSSTLNSLIKKSTSACRKSRLAFVFVQTLVPSRALSPEAITSRKRRFIEAEAISLECVHSTLRFVEKSDRQTVLDSTDSDLIRNSLDEYAKHMQFRIDRVAESIASMATGPQT